MWSAVIGFWWAFLELGVNLLIALFTVARGAIPPVVLALACCGVWADPPVAPPYYPANPGQDEWYNSGWLGATELIAISEDQAQVPQSILGDTWQQLPRVSVRPDPLYFDYLPPLAALPPNGVCVWSFYAQQATYKFVALAYDARLHLGDRATIPLPIVGVTAPYVFFRGDWSGVDTAGLDTGDAWVEFWLLVKEYEDGDPGFAGGGMQGRMIPEPAASWLLLLGGGGALFVRRRRLVLPLILVAVLPLGCVSQLDRDLDILRQKRTQFLNAHFDLMLVYFDAMELQTGNAQDAQRAKLEQEFAKQLLDPRTQVIEGKERIVSENKPGVYVPLARADFLVMLEEYSDKLKTLESKQKEWTDLIAKGRAEIAKARELVTRNDRTEGEVFVTKQSMQELMRQVTEVAGGLAAVGAGTIFAGGV